MTTKWRIVTPVPDNDYAKALKAFEEAGVTDEQRRVEERKTAAEGEYKKLAEMSEPPEGVDETSWVFRPIELAKQIWLTTPDGTKTEAGAWKKRLAQLRKLRKMAAKQRKSFVNIARNKPDAIVLEYEPPEAHPKDTKTTNVNPYLEWNEMIGTQIEPKDLPCPTCGCGNEKHMMTEDTVATVMGPAIIVKIRCEDCGKIEAAWMK